jgi:hypothetical protein
LRKQFLTTVVTRLEFITQFLLVRQQGGKPRAIAVDQALTLTIQQLQKLVLRSA